MKPGEPRWWFFGPCSSAVHPADKLMPQIDGKKAEERKTPNRAGRRMNFQDNNFRHDHDNAEMLERLAVFLPRSVVRALHEQVPAGQRRAFITRALAAALKQKESIGS